MSNEIVRSNSETVLRRFWKKRSIKVVTFIAIFITGMILATPFAAKLYLQKWLLENGADVAVVKKIRFNPFTGMAALEGVNVEKNGKTVFSNSIVSLDVGLKTLFSHEALLEQVTLTDVLIDIESREDGTIRLASYKMIRQQDDNTAVPEISSEEKEGNLPWVFRAQNIRLQNVIVRYQQPDISVTVKVEDALIEDINTDPNDKKGSLKLKGTVNGTPIALDLDTFVVIPEVDIQGKIAITDFQLDDLADFLSEYLKPFSGAATLDGKVSFSLVGSDDLRAFYTGLIHLDQGDLAGDGWATKGTINYDGKASFSMNEQEMVVDVDGDLQALQAAFDMPDPVIDIDNADIIINGKTTVTIAEEVIVDTSASLKLAPTTFGMDILKTSTGNLNWDGKVFVNTGTKSKELAVHADGVLTVEEPAYSMAIGDVLMEVGNRNLFWDGKVEYIKGLKEDSASFVRTDGTLKSDANTFALPEVIQIHQQDLNVTGKTEVAIGNDISVSYLGDIALDGTEVNMEGISIGDKQFTWSGKAKYEMGEIGQSVALDGTLKGEAIYSEFAGMYISQQSIATETDCVLSIAESPGFKGSLSLNAESTEIKKGETLLLSLAGVSLSNVKDNGSGGILAESLQLTEIDIPASENIPVAIAVPHVSINDIQSPDLLSGSIGNITVTKPLVVDAKGEVELAALGSITVNDTVIKKDLAIAVGGLTAEKGAFLKEKKKKAMVTLSRLQADKLNYSIDEGLVCNTINLDGLYANITKQKPTESKEKKEEKSSDIEGNEPEKAATAIPVQIKQLRVSGRSGFMFTDESFAKTFKTLFALKSLQVDDINLNKPEQPFPYVLEGAFDKYASLNAKGECAPLAANIFLEQKTSLQNYSMLQVSPYTIQEIGTFFPDGILDYTSEVKVADGRIDMENNLLFTDLKAETAADELAGELNSSLPIPLDLALTMLRDSQGNIDLDIPIDGKLSELHIGLTDIIITALAKGITIAVTPYLAYTALGPIGAAAFVGAKVGHSLLETDLPVLEFESDAQELTEAHKEILTRIGGEIKDDDAEIQYRICAKVAWADLSIPEAKGKEPKSAMLDEAVRKELFEIGERRSLLIQEFLSSSFGIDKKKLPVCNPGFEFEDGEKSKISFQRLAQ